MVSFVGGGGRGEEEEVSTFEDALFCVEKEKDASLVHFFGGD